MIARFATFAAAVASVAALTCAPGALAQAAQAPAPAPAPAAAGSAVLTVTFAELQAPRGQIMLALFDSEAAYGGRGAPVRQQMIAVTGETASVRLEGLQPGRYAVKAFHDVNGDGRMNSNPFGMPTEPFAFSNNAHGNMGPASWADAAFDVAATGATQSITLR